MSAPETHSNEGSTAHHPNFYFADGTAIFRLASEDCLAGCLYKLHPGLLSARSTFFSTLFSLPRSGDSPEAIVSEGKIDRNPIEIPSSISQRDFDHLLTYLYMGPSMYPSTEDFLISVMKLSTFFDIADGVEFATQEFARRGNSIHPATQFELARCFGIDVWIEQAFRRLMDLSLTALTAAQVAQIGHSGYFYLTQTKAKIQALRTKIAFHVPPIVNSPDCETPGTCLFTWKREWEERVRLLIHHPEHPISCLALLDQLRNVHIPGLCDGCQDLTVTWIWGKCLLTQEETLVDKAVASLMALQVEQPLRQALRESVINLISH